MPITNESACSPSKSFHGDDSHASFADPQPPKTKESSSVISQKTNHQRDREKYASIFKLVRQNLRLLDQPKAPEIGKDALHALGLLEFVQLCFPSPIASHRNLLVEFISFFSYDYGRSFFHGESSFVNKDVFGNALKLPSKALSRTPHNVPPKALTLAARKFMEAYILPVHKGTTKYTNGFSDRVGMAMNDVNDNIVYRVDWLSLIWEEALKELFYMIHHRNETISWDCFYSAYWLRVIWAKKTKLFSADVVLVSSVHAAASNVPLEKKGTPQACMVDEVRRTEHIDNDEGEEGENGDVPEVFVGDVSVRIKPRVLYIR